MGGVFIFTALVFVCVVRVNKESAHRSFTLLKERSEEERVTGVCTAQLGRVGLSGGDVFALQVEFGGGMRDVEGYH